jgi:hypothetical protein
MVRLGILALLAERKINTLRVINTLLKFDSAPGRHCLILSLRSKPLNVLIDS